MGTSPLVVEEFWPAVQVDVPCDQHAPGAVRRTLRTLDWIGQVSGDLLLIASELVTNAVLYSGCSKEDMISVRLDRAPGYVLLSISDPGARSAAEAVAAQRFPRDIGMLVVDRLARRWGAERIEGYRVWAELALGTASTGTDTGPGS